MRNLPIALCLAAFGATLVGPSAPAQGRGFASAAAGRGGTAFARARSVEATRGRGRGYFPSSAYAPYFYSDLGYASDLDSTYEPMLQAPPPQIVLGEPFQPAAPLPPPKPVEGPVLLELQGDHWVRSTSDGPPRIVGQIDRPQAERAPGLAAAPPSAVLVFRDGHQEQIGKYCIMGATIHISTDYWSTGSWTRTVHISDLDVPATLKLNRERGTHFRLPSGPYEVMIGG